MSKFLGLIKVSQDEAARMVAKGPRDRTGFLARLVHEAGGSVEGVWLTNVGDWDLICLVDMSEQTAVGGAAATLARRAAGLTDAERWIELVDVDGVDDAIAAMAGRG